MYREPYGWPEVLGSLFSGIVMMGGFCALVGWIWTQALSASPIIGLVAGGIAGGVYGAFAGVMVGSNVTRGRRQTTSYGAWAMLMALALPALIIGLIVWVVS